jgi:DNA-3-methyladenine glycosylase
VEDGSLARGPGNLAKALGVVGDDTGTDLLAGGRLTLAPGDAAGVVVAGPRVGVTQAWQVPWRFWVEADPTVSAYRRSPRIR